MRETKSSRKSHRVSMILSDVGGDLLIACATYHGLSRTGLVEKLLREEGRAIGKNAAAFNALTPAETRRLTKRATAKGRT